MSITSHAEQHPTGFKKWWSLNQRKVVPYIFITPTMLIFTTFVLIPIAYAAYISFFKWNGISEPEFNGIRNYTRLFEDDVFWTSLKNTIQFTLGVVPLSMSLGLLAAIGLNRKSLPGRGIFRAIYFLPFVISGVATATTAGGAYLNFMGNEFGHPEWIDFPREGNGWSYKYCRRIWSISEDPNLKYHWLHDFDKEMIHMIGDNKLLSIPTVDFVMENKPDNVLAYHRGLFLFVFNFNPTQSFTDYGIPLGSGKYKIMLNTDSGRFGGNDLVDEEISYYTHPIAGITSQHYLKLYLPARTALVLKKIDIPKVK